MYSIFGIFNRNAKPVSLSDLKHMMTAMPCRSDGLCAFWSECAIGLGQVSASEPVLSPSRNGLSTSHSFETFKFIATGRLDNADVVAKLLRITQIERSRLSDYDIMKIAYGTWGDECSTRLYGDWSFAAWHPEEQRLVISRDHHGHTALYYYLDHKVFAFATSRHALLALNLTPIELDELYLAQYLTSWQDYNGQRTLHSPIKRLPPSHYLSVKNDSSNIYRYWRLEDTPELLLTDRRDYVAAFREVFGEAVRCRLRSPGLIGVSMSGGLDSGSVAAVAARQLKADGQRLPVFTSVPHYQPPSYIVSRFNNEFPMAKATANLAENIDLHSLTSATASPIMAIRRVLELNCDPSHGACNLYWAIAVRQAAKSIGCTALLTGSAGNAGISWIGSVLSQPLAYQLAKLSWGEFSQRSRHRIKSVVPTVLCTTLQRYRMEQKEWWRSTAIHPDFARRIRLLEKMLADPNEQDERNARSQRCQMIKPGRSIAGAGISELGAAFGLTVLDPTADARVLAFTLSVPDHIFIDPETDTDRWLIREAMKGYLPEEVRLNRKRGLQASDLVLRLRAFSGDVDTALDELERGPSAAYVDIDHLRGVWQVIQDEDTAKSFIMASNILTRGIMAGLFVNRFYA